MATERAMLPLQERVPLKSTLRRLSQVAVLVLLLCLLAYRVASIRSHGHVWLLALLCESCFTVLWYFYVSTKWTPVTQKTHPERLAKRLDDLPAVDTFVTTADPTLEPPLVTMNTVLSLLAVEYPADKLACYLSDDACSPATFYSLVETCKFAKLWVPFCKNYNVRVRSPLHYFAASTGRPDVSEGSSEEFSEDWKHTKNEYEELCRKIENAGEHVAKCITSDEFADFSNLEPGNHQAIVKVVWDNGNKKDVDGGLAKVVYVAREKRRRQPHHYKAGAMNVLTRVSGVMTNAPIMLNVDCDMFANNPEVILHAMCVMLGSDDDEALSGFVQAPQEFYGGLKDDPFGNQLKVPQKTFMQGTTGIQGPFYMGTGCFHRRKIIYGAHPHPIPESTSEAKLSAKELQAIYGNSREFTASAAQIISEGGIKLQQVFDLTSRIDAATRVASCAYEVNTCWGEEIGWMYGSVTEDLLTGIRIHSRGWKSVYLTLEPPAFLGTSPTGGPASLTQMKRWATGLLEVLLSRDSPIIGTITRKLQFRQALAYMCSLLWPIRPIAELCYALLPAYSLLANTRFLPKASEASFALPLSVFVAYKVHTLMEYLQCGVSVREWWNNQRMARIYSLTAWLLGFCSGMLKTLGVSETVFEVTGKADTFVGDAEVDDPGRFTFDASPAFVPGTAVVLVNMLALVVGLLRLRRPGGGAGSAPGAGEFACSGWLLVNFWPFVRGLLVGRGKHGIPWSVIWKSAFLVLIFLQSTLQISEELLSSIIMST